MRFARFKTSHYYDLCLHIPSALRFFNVPGRYTLEDPSIKYSTSQQRPKLKVFLFIPNDDCSKTPTTIVMCIVSLPRRQDQYVRATAQVRHQHTALSFSPSVHLRYLHPTRSQTRMLKRTAAPNFCAQTKTGDSSLRVRDSVLQPNEPSESIRISNMRHTIYKRQATRASIAFVLTF
jgi:hypothetical protein